MSGFLCSMVGASFTVAAAAEVLRSKKGITAVGNAQVDTAQSKFGGASALFDGTGDYLSIAHHSSLSLADYSDWTIECWSRLTEGTGRTILNKDGVAGSAYPGYTFYTNSSKQVTFGVGGSAGNWITVTRSTALADNTWYHLAGVKNGSTVTFYVDGVSAGTATWVGYANQSQPLFIGYEQNGTSMYGHIDEVRISNSARYTANFTPSTSAFVNDANTLFLMHANGTDATTFFEDDNGTGRSQVGIIGVSTAQIDTAQSKFGGSSLYLDGNWSTTNAMLNVGNSSNFAITSGNWTIECWIRLPATNLSGLIISFYGDSATNNFILYHENTDLVFYAFGAGRITASATLSANTWHHVAVSKSGSSTRMFKDGTQVGSTYTDNNTYTASGFGIGTSFQSAGGSSNYEGWIDEVRVSNIARYTAGFTAPTAAFVNDADTLVLIHMDGTDASTVFRDDNGVRASKGISAVGNAQVDTAQSQFGSASALFDGTGDYLLVDNIAGGITEDQTFEFWIRFADLPASSGYRMVAGDGSSTRYLGLFNDSGTYRWEVSFASGQYVERFTTSVSTGVWYHVALTKSGSTLKMYQAGTALTSAVSFNTMTAAKTLFTSSTNYIGSWNTSSNFFNGHMDEIRVSNNVRYTTTFTPSTTPFQSDANTVLLLHMDGTDGSTVFFDDNGIAPYTP